MNEPPTELAAILRAYCEATKLHVRVSYQRELDLKEIHERGITPEDIAAVMAHLKSLVDSRDPRNDCYRAACLDWRNAMGDVDRLEERVARLRQEALRKEARKPKPPVAVTDHTGVTRLVDAPEKPVNIVDAADALRGMADDLQRRAL